MADLTLNPPSSFDRKPWDPYLVNINEGLWRRFRWFVDVCRDELGIEQYVVSGFRPRSEQEYLFNCYQSRLRTGRCNCGSCNLAATPGTSKHEKGLAIDCGVGYTRYPAMRVIAGRCGLGFTVPSEDWHLEVIDSSIAIPAKYSTYIPPPSEEDDMPDPIVAIKKVAPGKPSEYAIFYPGQPFRVPLRTDDDVRQATTAPPLGMGIKYVGEIDPWFFRNTEPVDSHESVQS